MLHPSDRDLLVTYLQPQWQRVVLLAALLFGGIGLQLIGPQIIRYFIDTTQAGVPSSVLLGAALLFIVVAFAQRGIGVLTGYLGDTVAWTATNALRANLARHCLGLDLAFHRTHTPGEMIERLDGDVEQLGNYFSNMAIHLLGNALLLLGILALLYRADWRVGLALSAYAAIVLVLLRGVQRLARPVWRAVRQANADSSAFLEERLSGMEDVRANGAGPYAMRRFHELSRRLWTAGFRGDLIGILSFSTSHFLYVAGYTLGLALGAYFYLRGQASIGAVFLITSYIGMLSQPLEAIRRQTDNLQAASACIDRVDELRQTRPTILDAPREVLPPDALSVRCEAVSFAYDGDDDVLHDVSFRLEPGRVLGVLGRTGSGKTTLTRLLFRLYEPQVGVLRLNEVNVRDLRQAELRSRVAMVTQDVQLFGATIRDNLTFFNPRIPTAILSALEELGLLAWLRALPSGLNTYLPGGGQGLSAGEAQLLAFARVFLRNPSVMVLDEASSRLDPATEQMLDRALGTLLKGRTSIIVAHRLETVARVDDILILEAGRVIEYGPRHLLARDTRSRFSCLLQAGMGRVLV